MATYIMLEQYDKAMEQYLKAKEINPEHAYPEYHLARLYYNRGNKGDYEEAIRIIQELIERGLNMWFHLGYTYALSGEREKAEQILNTFLEQYRKGKKPFSAIAMIYAGLGENDKAFEWLEKAGGTLFLKCDPEWNPIRSDPRYKALLKKMGLPED